MVGPKTIFLAGHKGLAGSAIHRALLHSQNTIITKSRNEVDLTDNDQVENLFKNNSFDVVIIAAAKVGGIMANKTYPYDFIYHNLVIQTNVINCAHKYDVNRLIFLGSSCIYPREAQQPLMEEFLLSGHLEQTNQSYAIAKIAGIEMIRALRIQHNRNYIALMPTNLYGIGDNYHPQNSHVLPALIRKSHEAKIANQKKILVWGSGKPRREFLCSDDLASAVVHLLGLDDELFNKHCIMNVGYGFDYTIAELVERINAIVGFKGKVEYQTSMPDGTYQKLLDSSLINKLGWSAKISLDEGIALSYQDYLSKIKD